MKIGYYLFDPDDLSVPVYVGVGSSSRKANHWKEYRYRKVKNREKDKFYHRLALEGKKPVWRPVKEFDTLEEALRWEMEEIARIGRKDLGLGPLLNRTDGGDNRGRILNEEARENLRTAVWENPEVLQRIREKNKQAHGTPEAREGHRRRALKQMAQPGAKENLSEKSKALWADPVKRAKLTEAIRAAGKTESSFENRSLAQKKSKNRPEQKLRASVKQQVVWDRMTPEQKAERSEKIKAGMAAALERKRVSKLAV